MGATATTAAASAPDMAAAAAAAAARATNSSGQPLAPDALAALHAKVADAFLWQGTNVVKLDIADCSSSTVSSSRRGAGGGGDDAAAAAAGTSSAAAATAHSAPGDATASSGTFTRIMLESSHAPGPGQPLLLAAAVAAATAEVTQHPRALRYRAMTAAACAPHQPPLKLVMDIEEAFRHVAAQQVRQLHPGGTHFWRGKAADKQIAEDSANAVAVAAARAAAGERPLPTMSHDETAAAAAVVGATAASGQAAADAAIAAAAAAGRHCKGPDLHAAWLMQRLLAGAFDVVVQPPVVDRAALLEAFLQQDVQPVAGAVRVCAHAHMRTGVPTSACSVLTRVSAVGLCCSCGGCGAGHAGTCSHWQRHACTTRASAPHPHTNHRC
jgi:hypothetical protein